jgi:hypothetical protein
MKKQVILGIMSVLVFLFTLPCISLGNQYAVITTESKGVRAGVYTFTWDDESLSVKHHYSHSENINVMGRTKDYVIPDDVMDDAVKTTKNYYITISNKFPKAKIFCTISSAYSRVKNVGDLKNRIISDVQCPTEIITAEKEAYYGILASIPSKRRGQSILIDTGSGNTKVGAMIGARLESVEIPYGTVTLRKAAQDEGGDYIVALNSLIKNKVLSDYMKSVLEKPALANRKRIYWIGGAGWATSTFTHPERVEKDFVYVNAKDQASFYSMLQNNEWLDRKVTPANVGGKVVAEKANAAMQNVRDTFTREDLMAGLSIIRALMTVSPQGSDLIFCRNGNWIFGYAQEKSEAGANE